MCISKQNSNIEPGSVIIKTIGKCKTRHKNIIGFDN